MWSVDWSSNLHSVANGGHGFSLKLEKSNPVNTWGLLKCSFKASDGLIFLDLDFCWLFSIFKDNKYFTYIQELLTTLKSRDEDKTLNANHKKKRERESNTVESNKYVG